MKLTPQSLRQNMEEENFSESEIEDALEDFWDAKIDAYEANKEFNEAYP